MTMAVRQEQSPQILDSGNTPMARLRSNLLNNCGKAVILAHQQSPSIWRQDILDNGNGGASEIFLNS
jgi:hypothetical protein